MNNDETADADVPSPLSQTAEAHSDLLRAYLALQGYGGAIGLACLAVPLLGEWTVHFDAKPWRIALLLAVNTWAAFRTRRLLKEHDRNGALMAVGTFAWNLIAARTTGYFTAGALLSSIGVVLATHVWWQLRRSEQDAV